MKKCTRSGELIRLIGLRLDNLVDSKEHQISLFENNGNKKQEKLDKILDSINEKYGNNSITRAGKMNVGKIIKLKE